MSFNRSNNFSGIGKFLLENTTLENSLNYQIVDYTTPAISLGSMEIKYKGEVGAIPGDLSLDPATKLRFIIDEDLIIFFSLYNLMQFYSKNKSLDTFTLKITNNKSKVIAQMNYNKCFISNLSEIQYSTTDEKTTMFIDVTLSFLTFKPEGVI